jgi:GntR family transcriptional regulator
VINKDSSIPLYIQIKEMWQEQIEQNMLKPGDQIPTENELCRLYDVSRITVKQAINLLVGEGYLVRSRGKGTYVKQPKLEQNLAGVTSFTDDMIRRGLRPGATLLDCAIQTAESDMVARLKLSDGERVIKIQRLRLADGQPIAIEMIWLPYNLCPSLLHEDLTASIYQILKNRYKISFSRAVQYLEASKAGKKEAKLLQIEPGDSVLQMERLSYINDNVPVEFTQSVYRGDRYKFRVELSEQRKEKP